jgi:hypothetical protein
VLDRLAAVARLPDLDLAGPGPLQDRDPDGQDAVVVRGLDRLGVQVLGQVDPAGEPITRSRTKTRSFSPYSSLRRAVTDSTPRSTVTSMEPGSMPGRSNRRTTSSARRIPSIGIAAPVPWAAACLVSWSNWRSNSCTKGSIDVRSIVLHLRRVPGALRPTRKALLC